MDFAIEYVAYRPILIEVFARQIYWSAMYPAQLGCFFSKNSSFWEPSPLKTILTCFSTSIVLSILELWEQVPKKEQSSLSRKFKKAEDTLGSAGYESGKSTDFDSANTATTLMTVSGVVILRRHFW